MNIKYTLLCLIALSTILSTTTKAQSVNKSFLQRAFLTKDKCTYENLTTEQKEQCSRLNKFTTKTFAQEVLLSPETNSDNVEEKMTKFLNENFITPFSILYSTKEMSYKALRYAYSMREALVERNKLIRQSIIETRNNAKSLEPEEKERIEKIINNAQEACNKLPHSKTYNFYHYDDYTKKVNQKRERGPHTKVPYSQYDCSKDYLEYRMRPLKKSTDSYIDNSIFAESDCQRIYKYTDNKDMISACHLLEGLTAEKFADEVLLSPSTTKENVAEKTTEFFDNNLFNHFNVIYPIKAMIGNQPYPMHPYNKLDLLAMENTLHEAHKMKHQLIRQASKDVQNLANTLPQKESNRLKNILFATQKMHDTTVLKNLNLNEKDQKNKQKDVLLPQALQKHLQEQKLLQKKELLEQARKNLISKWQQALHKRDIDEKKQKEALLSQALQKSLQEQELLQQKQQQQELLEQARKNIISKWRQAHKRDIYE